MKEFDVRRLAAVDMWGGSGSMLRRRLILMEFLLGSLGGLALGIWMLLDVSDGFVLGLGLWAIGVGVNYVPLAIYAVEFSRGGTLERVLEGVDFWSELRYYTGAQFRVFVPLWIAIIAVRQAATE